MPVILTASTDYHSFLGINTGYNDGHTWVCDGYLQSTYTGCDGELVLGATYLLLDMNWGWDGNSDGWYDFDYWSVLNGTTQNYLYNRAMTYNIHP